MSPVAGDSPDNSENTTNTSWINESDGEFDYYNEENEHGEGDEPVEKPAEPSPRGKHVSPETGRNGRKEGDQTTPPGRRSGENPVHTLDQTEVVDGIRSCLSYTKQNINDARVVMETLSKNIPDPCVRQEFRQSTEKRLKESESLVYQQLSCAMKKAKDINSNLLSIPTQECSRIVCAPFHVGVGESRARGVLCTPQNAVLVLNSSFLVVMSGFLYYWIQTTVT